MGMKTLIQKNEKGKYDSKSTPTMVKYAITFLIGLREDIFE